MWKVRNYGGQNTTHEGANARRLTPEQQLRRSVLSCMLWEDTFYEDGESISGRIESLCKEVDPNVLAKLAVEARTKFKLRSVPVLLARSLAKKSGHPRLIRKTIENVIQRPDEIYRFLELYWKEKKQPLSRQVKRALSNAIKKFNAASLAKYKGNEHVSLKDVIFLCHPKPANEEQAKLFRQVIGGFCTCGHSHWVKEIHKNQEICPENCGCTTYVEDKLALADTWETAFTSTEGQKTDEFKKDTWERLLNERKLGPMALLKALRNMENVGVDTELIKSALNYMKVERILPFRFITADRYSGSFRKEIESAMMKCLKGHEKITGKTVLLVDVSGSMDHTDLRSSYNRIDIANGLAILLREICEDISIYSFSNEVVKIMPERGFDLAKKIYDSQFHQGTYLGKALTGVAKKEEYYDRVIVITDEQSADNIDHFDPKIGYMINVAPYQHGIDFGDQKWVGINGFSEAVIDFILQLEKEEKSDFASDFEISWSEK